MYFENRCAAIDKYQQQGVSSYPHKFQMDMQLDAFRKKYEGTIPAGESVKEVVSITGMQADPFFVPS